MSQTQHITDGPRGLETLVWPIGQRMTFYSVQREDGPGCKPFVRDFHQASALALQAKARGGIWRVHQWEWNPVHDEPSHVGPAAPAVGGQQRVLRARPQ